MDINSLEPKIDRVIDATFKNDQRQYLNALNSGISNSDAQFTQAQIDFMLSIIEAASKRAAKNAVIIALTAVNEEM